MRLKQIPDSQSLEDGRLDLEIQETGVRVGVLTNPLCFSIAQNSPLRLRT